MPGRKYYRKRAKRNSLKQRVFFFSILLFTLFTLPFFIQRAQKGNQVGKSQAASTCGNLTYPCQEGLIFFPKDEGKHSDKQAEWWYANFNATSSYGTPVAGAFALVRANDGGGDKGYALLEITNESTKDFFFRVLPGSITSAEGKMNVSFSPDSETEISSIKFYQDPSAFRYKFLVEGTGIKINLSMSSNKRPLVEGGDGYVPIFPSSPQLESGYYSITSITPSGSLTLPTVPSFTINNALGWIDHQWFNLPSSVSLTSIDPSVLKGNHEWFSIQLDNGVQIVAWQIFKQTSAGLVIGLKNLDIITKEGRQTNYSDFSLTPLTFWTAPDGKIFAKSWRIEKRGVFDFTVETSIPNQYVTSWKTYEGSQSVVSGTYNGYPVKGQGFAEMTLTYPTGSCRNNWEICDSKDNDCDYRVDEICSDPSRPPVCSGSYKSKTEIIANANPPAKMTITGISPVNTSISKFHLAFYNLDNLYGPNNPKPIIFRGAHFVKESSSCTGYTCTIPIYFTDLNYPDGNWSNKYPVNIQVNGYFTTSDGKFSQPEPDCVQNFKVIR